MKNKRGTIKETQIFQISEKKPTWQYNQNLSN